MAEPSPELQQILAQAMAQYTPGRVNMEAAMGAMPENFFRDQQELLERYPDLPAFQDVVTRTETTATEAMNSAAREAAQLSQPILAQMEAERQATAAAQFGIDTDELDELTPEQLATYREMSQVSPAEVQSVLQGQLDVVEQQRMEAYRAGEEGAPLPPSVARAQLQAAESRPAVMAGKTRRAQESAQDVARGQIRESVDAQLQDQDIRTMRKFQWAELAAQGDPEAQRQFARGLAMIEDPDARNTTIQIANAAGYDPINGQPLGRQAGGGEVIYEGADGSLVLQTPEGQTMRGLTQEQVDSYMANRYPDGPPAAGDQFNGISRVERINRFLNKPLPSDETLNANLAQINQAAANQGMTVAQGTAIPAETTGQAVVPTVPVPTAQPTITFQGQPSTSPIPAEQPVSPRPTPQPDREIPKFFEPTQEQLEQRQFLKDTVTGGLRSVEEGVMNFLGIPKPDMTPMVQYNGRMITPEEYDRINTERYPQREEDIFRPVQ